MAEVRTVGMRAAVMNTIRACISLRLGPRRRRLRMTSSNVASSGRFSSAAMSGGGRFEGRPAPASRLNPSTSPFVASVRGQVATTEKARTVPDTQDLDIIAEQAVHHSEPLHN